MTTVTRPRSAADPIRATRRPTVLDQLVRFVAIGVVSTLAYVILYAALRTWFAPVAANAAALVMTAIGNTAANRRLTFAVQGRDGLLADHAVGIAALGVALAITTGSIALLGALAPAASRLVEIVVLVLANAVATVARFVLLRSWLTRRIALEEEPR